MASRLRSLPPGSSPTLEEILQEYQNEANDGDLRRAQQVAHTRFYLQEIAWKFSDWLRRAHFVSNLSRLVDEIEHWRVRNDGTEVAWMTLNYDTLLEQTIQREVSGARYGGISDYVAGSHKVFKVHGSWNWGRAVTNKRGSWPSAADIRSDLANSLTELDISSEFRVLPSLRGHRMEGRTFQPWPCRYRARVRSRCLGTT